MLQENSVWDTEAKIFDTQKVQKLLSQYYYLSDKVIDEAFCNEYLEGFVPVLHSELPKVT